jgi:hypothetical protein
VPAAIVAREVMPSVGIERVASDRVVFKIDRSAEPLKLGEPRLVHVWIIDPGLEEMC